MGFCSIQLVSPLLVRLSSVGHLGCVNFDPITTLTDPWFVEARVPSLALPRPFRLPDLHMDEVMELKTPPACDIGPTLIGEANNDWGSTATNSSKNDPAHNLILDGSLSICFA